MSATKGNDVKAIACWMAGGSEKGGHAERAEALGWVDLLEELAAAGFRVVRDGQAVVDGRVFVIEVFNYLHWQRRGWVDARLRPSPTKTKQRRKRP